MFGSKNLIGPKETAFLAFPCIRGKFTDSLFQFQRCIWLYFDILKQIYIYSFIDNPIGFDLQTGVSVYFQIFFNPIYTTDYSTLTTFETLMTSNL